MDKEILRQRHQLIINQALQLPTVFKQQIEQWECRHWSLTDWSLKLNAKKLKFRVGPITNQKGGPIWENQCQYVETTMEEFMQRHQATSKNPFFQYPVGTHWVYADYKYMAQLFDPDDHVNKTVDWNFLGFAERDGLDSTFWLGEKHSHTPCHFDTYGCNVVAQLIGSKRWVLFPPTSTAHLYPTRIPYEESSVFSEVDVINPNFVIHPKFKSARPFVVTLHPGDVLYVPPMWWHFVQSTSDITLSINSWIELDDDRCRRLEEAVCRLLVTNFTQVYPINSWLNPTEDIAPSDVNLQFIQHCLRTLKESGEKKPDEDKSSPVKRIRSFSDQSVKDLLDDCFGKENYFIVKEISLDEYLKKIGCNDVQMISASKIDDEEDIKKAFLTALLHPEVISLICQKLSDQYG
ncbi:HSPB (Heat shock 27kDa) associated protein 1 [Chamberlinius hualienensis]